MELQKLRLVHTMPRMVAAIESELLPAIVSESLERHIAGALVDKFTHGAKVLNWEGKPDMQLLQHLMSAASSDLVSFLCILCIFSASEELVHNRKLLRSAAVQNAYVLSWMIQSQAESHVNKAMKLSSALSEVDIELEEEIQRLEYEVGFTRQHYIKIIEYLGRLAGGAERMEDADARDPGQSESIESSSNDEDSLGPMSEAKETSDESEKSQEEFAGGPGSPGDQAVYEEEGGSDSNTSLISASARTEPSGSSSSSKDQYADEVSSIPGVDDMSSEGHSVEKSFSGSRGFFSRIWRKSFQRKSKPNVSSHSGSIPEIQEARTPANDIASQLEPSNATMKSPPTVSATCPQSTNETNAQRDVYPNGFEVKQGMQANDLAEKRGDSDSDDVSQVLNPEEPKVTTSSDASSDDESTVDETSERDSRSKSSSPRSSERDYQK